MVMCVTVSLFPLAYTTFPDLWARRWGLPTLKWWLAALYPSFITDDCATHTYIHLPPLHIHSFTNMNLHNKCKLLLRDTIFGTCRPCGFSIVLLPWKWTLVGFMRSHLRLQLLSISGGRSPKALLRIVWVHYKNIFLESDLVSHQAGLHTEIEWWKMIKRGSFWQNKSIYAVHRSSAVTDKWKSEQWIPAVHILMLWKSPNTLTAHQCCCLDQCDSVLLFAICQFKPYSGFMQPGQLSADLCVFVRECVFMHRCSESSWLSSTALLTSMWHNENHHAQS